MSISKNHIISEIQRTSTDNGGEPLGVVRFAAETGIAEADWFGIHWARWSDAVRDAGFEPNRLQGAYQDHYLLDRYAALAVELHRLPVKGDLKLKRRSDTSFPSFNVYARFGTKADLIEKLERFCSTQENFREVAKWCGTWLADQKNDGTDETVKGDAIGYVYLIQHGNRKEYKIGRTSNLLRRAGEISVELPEKSRPVHSIKTDDPSGIEAYWHRRFAAKRKNGEWFELTATDVAAFKRRKFM